ncbi:amidase [Patulibacter defluvii]|uniref:amidase n=1 Tax=Patulibacter defluvii TaxID=3095358 RepID=UPI002A76051E|nr:amidase family protein [Patulibacter sp. DM4]
MSPSDLPLHWWSARDLAAAIRERRVSAVEVMTAFLDRIDAIDGQVNAITTRVPRAQALAMAADADAAVARGDALGPIHGLPIAVKDLMDVAGLRTTQGVRAFADAPPAAHDSVLAEKLRAAGALIIGKTNTPAYGLGTVTFNPLFGPTRNPWDLTKNAGGSSGGAGAAVAAGMLPFADGSDSGGSIRYPAAFGNLVGLRPTPGRVPTGRRGDGWAPHGVLGPIARDAADAGLLLSAISGPDPRAPLSLAEDPAALADVTPRSLEGLRIAWSRTGGGLPVDGEVLRVLDAARATLESHGAIVSELDDGFWDGADECWQIVEMLGFLDSCGEDVAAHRDTMPDDLVRNVEEGRALSAERIVHGLRLRTELFRRTERVLADHDVIALPTTPLIALPADETWPREVAGVAFDRYFLWQRLACRVTVTAHPAASVPGGFSADGLPVGLQLIGRHRGDRELLDLAAGLETATGWGARRPPL